ncbi:MAG: ROK family transcriptional regulator [Pseudomonadota bacterium]
MKQHSQTAQGKRPSFRSGASNGATPAGVRNYNERLVLSVIKNEGQVASAQIARLTSLSAQTASNITRSLEADGMLLRGTPQRGRVGKPSVPVYLNPEGSLAYGLRVGRRGADLVLMNIIGSVIDTRSVRYDYPVPEAIDAFVAEGMASMEDVLPVPLRARIVGIGVAMPFGLWHKPEAAGAPPGVMDAWRGHDFVESFARFTRLPVLVANDASMGCSGELIFGAGEALSDFLYFYVGAFVGGGVVLDGKVFFGKRGNAGAMGTVLVDGLAAEPNQLVHRASIYVLEQELSQTSGRDVRLRMDSPEWTLEDPRIDAWTQATAQALASAAVSSAALVDVDTVVVDGGFPASIKDAVINRMRVALENVDMMEIRPVRVHAGVLGRISAAMGAAYQPILGAHFLEGSKLGAFSPTILAANVTPEESLIV